MGCTTSTAEATPKMEIEEMKAPDTATATKTAFDSTKGHVPVGRPRNVDIHR